MSAATCGKCRSEATRDHWEYGALCEHHARELDRIVLGRIPGDLEDVLEALRSVAHLEPEEAARVRELVRRIRHRIDGAAYEGKA